MLTNCTTLAAALSSNYVSSAPFGGSTAADLPPYLASNGVLISVCRSPTARADASSCAPTRDEDHVAASWINADLGLRIVTADLPVVGVVLDPTAACVRCLYPTDAVTDVRDDAGCGPETWDPRYGSKGAERLGPIGRLFVRRLLEFSFRSRFGPNATWEDVPCHDFFQPPTAASGTAWRSAGNCEAIKAGRGEVVYGSALRELSRWYTPILGHPPCSMDDDDIGPRFSAHNWWVYFGECSWRPEEWQGMVDTMRNKIIAKGPEVSLWNEIVLSKPKAMGSIVSAVFFIWSPQMDEATKSKVRQRAVEEAALLGGKPVFVVDTAKLAVGSPLFKCASSDSDQQVVSESSFVPLGVMNPETSRLRKG